MSVPEYSPEFIHFFGLRRSGNHILIHWLMEGLKRKKANVLHFNNVADYVAPKGVPLESVYRGEVARIHPDISILSYEDQPYDQRLSFEQYRLFSNHNSQDLILLRSFPNLLASQIRRRKYLEESGITGSIQKISLQDVRDRWVQLAYNILNADGRSFVSVLYDKWVTEQAYRDTVAKKFGFINHDASLDYVPGVGAGSSFDSTRMQGRGNEMRTLDRWEYFLHDREARATYTSLVTAEVNELNKAIFGAGPMIIPPAPHNTSSRVVLAVQHGIIKTGK